MKLRLLLRATVNLPSLFSSPVGLESKRNQEKNAYGIIQGNKTKSKNLQFVEILNQTLRVNLVQKTLSSDAFGRFLANGLSIKCFAEQSQMLRVQG